MIVFLAPLFKNDLLTLVNVFIVERSTLQNFYDYLFRYTPSQQGQAFNSGAKQRVIRMVEMQKDPMEPPKFKYNLF